ncbi:uncharacterized protein [Parasteatoda tepidariorum]|uniref:uncharacterized protein n=1 Tax=Parasteatoda tepidariorum TaxID=114398 RepID=UPI001C72045D|nr:uncharacterized protein LOC122272256 [Parasteatoda tepidariorum]
MIYNSGVGPSLNSNSLLRVLQWNAGGLSHSKRAELCKTFTSYDIDVFTIMEANLSQDSIKYCSFPGYALYLLPKARQVASGLLMGVKKHLTSDFQIIKEMNDSDKTELIKLKIWKDGHAFKIYSTYCPHNNTPHYNLPSILSSTIFIGDFNAHSLKWGYNDTNQVGSRIVDLLNTSTLELVYNCNDPCTFLHYNGTKSNPDLLMVLADLCQSTTQRVLGDPGSEHRQILADISFSADRRSAAHPTYVSWNFVKANWKLFTDTLKQLLQRNPVNPHSHPDAICTKLNNYILDSAKIAIPRGRVKRYSSF